MRYDQIKVVFVGTKNARDDKSFTTQKPEECADIRYPLLC